MLARLATFSVSKIRQNEVEFTRQANQSVRARMKHTLFSIRAVLAEWKTQEMFLIANWQRSCTVPRYQYS